MDALERLMEALGRLPGVGRRTSERIALRLVRQRALLRELTAALQTADAEIRLCRICGNLTTEDRDPCRLCTDPRRDTRQLCVVEEPSDIVQLEKSGAFRGRYHALMGRLSPMHNEGPQTPALRALFERVRAGGLDEVVLALNTDVESDATASYLKDQLQPLGVRVTRIALGIPAGSGIGYSDPVTLQRALEGRRDL
jgi:recombination protein RecR